LVFILKCWIRMKLMRIRNPGLQTSRPSTWLVPCTDISVNKNEYSPCMAGSYLILLSIYSCLLIRACILYTVGCHLCLSISIRGLGSTPCIAVQWIQYGSSLFAEFGCIQAESFYDQHGNICFDSTYKIQDRPESLRKNKQLFKI
jgi:hypothetical protein